MPFWVSFIEVLDGSGKVRVADSGFGVVGMIVKINFWLSLAGKISDTTQAQPFGGYSFSFCGYVTFFGISKNGYSFSSEL